MLKHFHAIKLNGVVSANIRFNDDVNIITGRNGSGKTTAMRAIWYLLSGKLNRLRSEMPFRYISLETTSGKVELFYDPQRRLTGTFNGGGETFTRTIEGSSDRPDRRDSSLRELMQLVNNQEESSVFFPTFRRIEGGFSLDDDQEGYYGQSLTVALQQVSQRLSSPKHRFVASISTGDIVSLLTTHYADVSANTNKLYSELSQFILHTVSQLRSSGGASAHPELAAAVVQDIERTSTNITDQRERILRPFSILSKLIEDIFRIRGIRISERIVLGGQQDVIGSEKLSAGEKQLLSFLCYNAFERNSVIFIDEPEISLHVDWQRTLLPILLSQSTGNQFVVATHSPFIYSKFPDKELMLNEDRGDSDADASANS